MLPHELSFVVVVLAHPVGMSALPHARMFPLGEVREAKETVLQGSTKVTVMVRGSLLSIRVPSAGTSWAASNSPRVHAAGMTKVS